MLSGRVIDVTRTERADIEEIMADLNLEDVFNKSFLITGATGSLARYCAMTLLEVFKRYPEKAGKVILLCRNREKACQLFSEYQNEPFFELIVGSVEQEFYYDGPINYIIHAACMSNSPFFATNPVETASANLIGTYYLLRLAQKKSSDGFLFFSSGAVFGGVVTNESEYVGIDPLQSKNCYAVSKKAGENLCVDFLSEYGLPAKIVRIGYTFGPHSDLEDGHLYSDFIRSVVNRLPLIIKGNRTTNIGLCYVTDAVRAFFLILFYGKAGTAYGMRNYDNIMPIEELAKKLVENVFPERGLTYHSLIMDVEKDTRTSLPPWRLYELGWKPHVSVEEGFRRCVSCVEEKREARK